MDLIQQSIYQATKIEIPQMTARQKVCSGVYFSIRIRRLWSSKQ